MIDRVREFPSVVFLTQACMYLLLSPVVGKQTNKQKKTVLLYD